MFNYNSVGAHILFRLSFLDNRYSWRRL